MPSLNYILRFLFSLQIISAQLEALEALAGICEGTVEFPNGKILISYNVIQFRNFYVYSVE